MKIANKGYFTLISKPWIFVLCSWISGIVIIASFDTERDNEIAYHKKCILSHKAIHRALIAPNASAISSAFLMYIIFKK